MDRLGFFKQGLSAATDVVGSIIGLKKAVSTFSEAVDEALSNIKSDMGLDLRSVQSDMIENAGGTLADIARMGYTMIEIEPAAGGKIHDMKPADFKALADKAGLKIAGAHMNWPHWELPATADTAADGRMANDGAADAGEQASATAAEATGTQAAEQWAAMLDMHRDLGCRYLTLSHLPENTATATVGPCAARLDLIGSLAQQRGMRLCFRPDRNHLAATDGVSVFDSIAGATDPEKVWFDIDTYEAAEAGLDTTALLRRYRNRTAILHAHDYGVVGESGRINFDAVIAEAVKCGVQDIFVEVRSYTLPPKNCVERSLYNLESLPSVRY